MDRTELPDHGITGIRADNPGPFSLTGTNTWIIGSGPAWVVDPGPALPAHLDAVAAAIEARGGLGGIALTHDHYDHSEAVPALRERFPDAPLAAGRGTVDVTLADGAEFGPLRAYYTPGHASDHYAFLTGSALLSGDAVLGVGSVFVAPEPGALAGYLNALARLRELPLAVILPGHGPVVTDPQAKLDEYRSHRLARETALVAALGDGRRSVEELLDAAWADVPAPLRPAAAVTLAAHLDKLEDEGRLPAGVERPQGIEAMLRAAAQHP